MVDVGFKELGQVGFYRDSHVDCETNGNGPIKIILRSDYFACELFY